MKIKNMIIASTTGGSEWRGSAYNLRFCLGRLRYKKFGDIITLVTMLLVLLLL